MIYSCCAPVSERAWETWLSPFQDYRYLANTYYQQHAYLAILQLLQL